MQPLVSRRNLLGTLVAGALLPLAGCRRRSDRTVVGFSQMDSGGAWRIAETNSMRAAAADANFELVVTDAQDQTAKQVADVEDLIARGVRVLFIAPREYDGIEPALEGARHDGVPVFLIDREAEGMPGVDYITFIGSDFLEQGRRAAVWLARHTGGSAGIVELTGTAGSSVARDRAAGFRAGLAGQPGLRIIASQTASFARSAAQGVMANLIQALGRQISAVFAHNDEMALGAIQVLRGASHRPGRDVTLVSIDGERVALEAILCGDLGASVESNPRIGPVAFDALERHRAGKEVSPRILLPDRLYDAHNAAAFVDEAY